MSGQMSGGYVNRQGQTVEAWCVDDASDILGVYSWLPEQSRVLSYPTAKPELFIGDTPPLALTGSRVVYGDWVVRGPAGDVAVMSEAIFVAEHEPVEVTR